MLRISQETSTVHEAEYSVEQDNTQLNLATLSISSDNYLILHHQTVAHIWALELGQLRPFACSIGVVLQVS
jgi:hypothetical protein